MCKQSNYDISSNCTTELDIPELSSKAKTAYCWLSMKAHIFERACPVYQEGAVTPIFEGDMPP
jgi:hypothetical protein